MSRNFNENAGVLSSADSEIPAIDQPTRLQTRAVSPLLAVISVVLLLAGIGALGWCSFSLAGSRMYQVDECLNVFVARTIATHQSTPGMDLFQLLLSWLLPVGARAAELFASARLVTWLIFWLNLILIALATGERIFSRRWLFALAGAATLAPLWDYGFEIRHDILLLAGVLLIWGVIRFQPPKLGTFFFVGACSVVLVFVSIKSILFTFPICLGVFLFPPPGQRPARWKLAVAGGLGVVLAFLVVQFLFKTAGLGEDHLLANVKGVAAVPSDSYRFWPFSLTLPRLLTQTPLMVALAMAAIITCAATVLREKRAALNWDGIVPEVLLLCLALTALCINPNPYPYNLLHVAPYAFLLAYRYGAILWKQFPQHATFAPVALSIVVFTHVIPFVAVNRRHWLVPNYDQERLMTLSEDLTDPDKDSIFDGVGMVPTRKICDMRTLIHGQAFMNLVKKTADGMKMRGFLAENPPSVVILNYRTEWMSDEDQAFLRERYVPIADDFMVLGSQLPAGGGTFEVFHAGRYLITSSEGSNIIGTYEEPKRMKEAMVPPAQVSPLAGTIDGKPFDGKPVELSVGAHHIECSPDHKAAVEWVGPHVDSLPRMMGMDRHRLFLNWY
jgi:hypothetical protein